MTRWLLFLALGWPLAVAARADDTQSFEGQVVCSECWTEADRTTTPYGTSADLKCAKDCAEKGKPRALAVREGEHTVLYLLYPGSYNPGKHAFLDMVPHRARVTGRVQSRGKTRLLFVDSIERMSAPVQQSETAGMAPELQLQDLSGSLQALSSLKGQVVVVNFWATFCPPCLREMPMLAKLQREYAARQVQVVGVAVEPFERRLFIRQLAQQKGANFPIWIGASTQHMEAFGLGTALPGTALIARDGRILARLAGELDEAQLHRLLDQAIVSQP